MVASCFREGAQADGAHREHQATRSRSGTVVGSVGIEIDSRTEVTSCGNSLAEQHKAEPDHEDQEVDGGVGPHLRFVGLGVRA